MYKFFWIALVGLSASFFAWFSGKTLFQLWDYSRVNHQTTAQITHWEIKELSSSAYTLTADYFFHIGEEKWEGKTQFRSFDLLNPFAAEQKRQKLSEQSWSVWYQPSNPQISSLERTFPSKSLFYAIFCLGILGYFLYRFQQHMKEGPIES